MVRASTVPGPVSNWPFVGRSGELATFRTLLADPSSRGVLVYGPAGVGKTRLAEQFATIATGLGRACGRATGSATAATVPLGALAHLLPAAVGRERLDPVALVDRVAEAFRHRSGGAPFVVHADDLHLLDITSLTLLTQLIDAAAVFLIGTVRADEPVPDALSALWRGGRLARIDLTDLSRDGVEELLSAVLRGPAGTGAARPRRRRRPHRAGRDGLRRHAGVAGARGPGAAAHRPAPATGEPRPSAVRRGVARPAPPADPAAHPAGTRRSDRGVRGAAARRPVADRHLAPGRAGHRRPRAAAVGCPAGPVRPRLRAGPPARRRGARGTGQRRGPAPARRSALRAGRVRRGRADAVGRGAGRPGRRHPGPEPHLGTAAPGRGARDQPGHPRAGHRPGPTPGAAGRRGAGAHPRRSAGRGAGGAGGPRRARRPPHR